MQIVRPLIRNLVLFIIFGIIYQGIEILYGGSTHWSSFIMGGTASVIIGQLNEGYDWDMPMWYQVIDSTIIVTMIEFVGGIIVNKLLKLDVWDYSSHPFNIEGQVCLQYSCYWLLLSLPVIYLDDYLRYKLFHERKPESFLVYIKKLITLK